MARYLNMKAARLGVPVVGNFELTPCCNLACKMCYVRLTKKQADERGGLLSAERWKRYIDESVAAGMVMMLITGGEPTMRPDFLEIYEYAHEKGVLVSVNTNGTLITDEILESFRRMPPARVNITLYGASEETYHELCGDGSAFRRVIEAIKKLKAAGIGVKLSFTLTRYNAHDLEGVMDIAKELDVFLRHTSYVFPPSRRPGEQADRLGPEESARAGLAATRRLMSPEGYRSYIERSLAGDPSVQAAEECVDSEDGVMRCRAGRSNFWLAWDGTMRPCPMMPGPGFEVEACGGIKPAWDRVREEVKAMRTPKKCEGCSARHVCLSCAAACICETGEPTTAPEYLCRRSQALIDIMKEELDEMKRGEA